MTRIEDLAADETVRQVVRDVTNRFLNLKEPTPRRHVYKKLDGKGKLIPSLLQYEFLRQPVNDNMLPGFLAFHYAETESLVLAKNGTSIVLQVLQNLHENNYSKQQFLTDEILKHAEQMFGTVILEQVRVGMLLAVDLSDFIAGSEWDDTAATLKWVAVHESIFDFRSIDIEWQQKLDRIKAREIVENNSSGRTKAEKFGILDSPACRQNDLQQPPGPQGRALFYVDIDHFKPLNTKYTETVIDQTILPAFQTVLRDIVATHGYVYAEGGDEVVILLNNSSLFMACAMAEDIRATIAAREFHVREDPISFTVSIGIAHSDHATDNDLQLKANAAENRSKENGRNRSTVALADSFAEVKLERLAFGQLPSDK